MLAAAQYPQAVSEPSHHGLTLNAELPKDVHKQCQYHEQMPNDTSPATRLALTAPKPHTPHQ